jgi:hypothetical protein
MTRNRREELSARIEQLLGSAEGGGRAAVYPIGKQEAAWTLRVATKGVPVKNPVTAASIATGTRAKAGGGDE